MARSAKGVASDTDAFVSDETIASQPCVRVSVAPMHDASHSTGTLAQRQCVPLCVEDAERFPAL